MNKEDKTIFAIFSAIVAGVSAMIYFGIGVIIP